MLSNVAPCSATAGDVVNVFLAILIGSFSLVMLGPEMQGTSLIKVYKRLNLIFLVSELSQMLKQQRPSSMQQLIEFLKSIQPALKV